MAACCTAVQVRSFYSYRIEQEMQEEEADILGGLSATLRSQLTLYVYKGLLTSGWPSPLLCTTPAVCKGLLTSGTRIQAATPQAIKQSASQPACLLASQLPVLCGRNRPGRLPACTA